MKKKRFELFPCFKFLILIFTKTETIQNRVIINFIEKFGMFGVYHWIFYHQLIMNFLIIVGKYVEKFCFLLKKIKIKQLFVHRCGIQIDWLKQKQALILEHLCCVHCHGIVCYYRYCLFLKLNFFF